MGKGIKREFKTFEEFYPFYLGEHSDPRTRAVHAWGTCAGIVLGATLLVLGIWWGVLAGIVLAYGAAWFSHFVFQKNKPATFHWPLWSFRSDFKMIKEYFAGLFS